MKDIDIAEFKPAFDYFLQLPDPPEGTIQLYAQPDEALLDLDTEAQVRQFAELLGLVDQFWGVGRVKIWPSRSKGVHAQVQIQAPLEPEQLFVIQAALGSDPKRELLYLARRRMGVDWNVLFKPDTRETDAAS